MATIRSNEYDDAVTECIEQCRKQLEKMAEDVLSARLSIEEIDTLSVRDELTRVTEFHGKFIGTAKEALVKVYKEKYDGKDT